MVSCPLCDRDRLRARVAELEKERDEAQRQHDGRVRQAEKLGRRLQVAEAFVAKIKGGLKDAWKGERAKLRAAAVKYRLERDEARGEVERLRAVFEAAVECVGYSDPDPNCADEWNALVRSVRAALSAKGNSDG